MPSTVIPFNMYRPALPSVALPLPTTSTVPALVATPTAVDLSGRRKVWFLIGRGRIGKTTMARWVSETLANQGGASFVCVAADPVNRSLRAFVDDVVEPPSADPDEVRDWLRGLLEYAMAEKQNAIIDLGGGNTSLSALLREMPDLADVLSRGGIEPVAVHVLGCDPHDLVPLALAESEGFQPRATAIVLNEAHGRRGRFDQVTAHPAFQDVMARGAVRLWMPLLSADAARQCDANAWHYHDVRGNAGPFVAAAVDTWLRRMADEMAPIKTWLPE
jgi:hypothetical protein